MRAEQDVEQIVQQNTGLIALLVGRTLRLCPRLPSIYDHDDLYSLGNLGLLSAARSFDPNRGVAFSTYAYRCIERAILGALRREWDQQVDCVCLSQLSSEDDDNPIEEQIPDRGADATAGAFNRYNREILQVAMQSLPSRQAQVIRSLYFDGDSVAEVAQRWRLSMHAVQRQHLLGLKALRLRLRQLGIRQWTD